MKYFQNLNTKPGDRKGSALKHCRFRLGDFSLEWVGFSRDLRLGFSIGEEYTLTLGLILFTIYVSYNKWVTSVDREFSIYFYSGALWFFPWKKDDWIKSDPWWVRGIIIHFDDLFLGKTKYSEQIIEEKNVLIPMPEGSYAAIAKLELATWKRQRWFSHSILRVQIEVPGGIPHEGKGENSWDCGEDGLYGITCPAKNINEGISKTVLSVLESRRKYGTPSRIKPIMAGVVS